MQGLLWKPARYVLLVKGKLYGVITDCSAEKMMLDWQAQGCPEPPQHHSHSALWPISCRSAFNGGVVLSPFFLQEQPENDHHRELRGPWCRHNYSIWAKGRPQRRNYNTGERAWTVESVLGFNPGSAMSLLMYLGSVSLPKPLFPSLYMGITGPAPQSCCKHCTRERYKMGNMSLGSLRGPESLKTGILSSCATQRGQLDAPVAAAQSPSSPVDPLHICVYTIPYLISFRLEMEKLNFSHGIY